MTMKKVNIFEAKARLSEYLDLVEGGERIVPVDSCGDGGEHRAILPGRDEVVH